MLEGEKHQFSVGTEKHLHNFPIGITRLDRSKIIFFKKYFPYFQYLLKFFHDDN